MLAQGLIPVAASPILPPPKVLLLVSLRLFSSICPITYPSCTLPPLPLLLLVLLQLFSLICPITYPSCVPHPPQVLLLVSLRLGIVPAIAGVSVTLLMVPLQAALVK